MELSALLCNYAEAQNNLLYISGGGIDRATVPPGVPPPWSVSMAIALYLRVPWVSTNQEHTLTVDLVDADGTEVQIPAGPQGEQQPFHAEVRFNVGRPASLVVGDAQAVSLAVSAPLLPFTKLGVYEFVIAVDGSELQRLSYRVATLPGVTLGGGAAGLPRL